MSEPINVEEEVKKHRPRIITCTIVKDELSKDWFGESRLKMWIANTKETADTMIIVDTGSTDGTFEYLEDLSKSFTPNKLILERSHFTDFEKDEQHMRSDAWDLVRKNANPGDYCLILDADEFVDTERLNSIKHEILNSETKYNYSFRICDMWSKEEYRIDGLWSPFQLVMFPIDDKPYKKQIQTGLHGGKAPEYIPKYRNKTADCKLLHYSYHSEEIRKQKSDYYCAKNEGVNLLHAQTILQPNPELRHIDYHKKKHKVLISCLVRNREWILPALLESFDNIDKEGLEVEFLFIVNNSTDKSEEIIKEWGNHKNQEHLVRLTTMNFPEAGEYKSHSWAENGKSVIPRMAKMRNQYLEIGRNDNFDYVFNVDSDILQPPELLKHLIFTDKDFVMPVFMATWEKPGDAPVNKNLQLGLNYKRDDVEDFIRKYNTGFLPQVWQSGGYEISNEMLCTMFVHRNVYSVGMGGAIMLLSKKVLNSPYVNYNRVYNLPVEMNGEDRDFCIRAKVCEIHAFASTFYDVAHCENETEIKEWKKTQNL